ncbi:MAG: hypothetical protein ONB12_12850, partial [candidate division KSB1 bacterium]|nr:hypothetical protein [candidate division KSB1 bacterium]
MRKLIISLVILFLLISEGKTQTPTNGIYRITKLSLKGNFSFADARLLQLMSSRPPSLRQRVLDRAELPPYTETLIENDLKQLIRFYRQEGFLDAVAIVAEKRINEKKHTVALVIEVIEGIPIKVESVAIDFDLHKEENQAAFLRSHVLAVLQLKPGKRFRDESFYRDVDRLQQALADLGYPYARI